jgi:Kef-type K+ transport system membrane component KefB
MLNLAEWWPAIALGAVVVTVVGKIIVVWLALRKTDTKDVPKTVTALAELFR